MEEDLEENVVMVIEDEVVYYRQTGRNFRRSYNNNKKRASTKRLLACHACNEQGHYVRHCPNKNKRNAYCNENKLCRWCCKKGHTLSNCPERKDWKNKSNKKRNYYQQNNINVQERKLDDLTLAEQNNDYSKILAEEQYYIQRQYDENENTYYNEDDKHIDDGYNDENQNEKSYYNNDNDHSDDYEYHEAEEKSGVPFQYNDPYANVEYSDEDEAYIQNGNHYQYYSMDKKIQQLKQKELEAEMLKKTRIIYNQH